MIKLFILLFLASFFSGASLFRILTDQNATAIWFFACAFWFLTGVQFVIVI